MKLALKSISMLDTPTPCLIYSKHYYIEDSTLSTLLTTLYPKLSTTSIISKTT